MEPRRPARQNHLRLVEPADPVDFSEHITIGELRDDIEHLVDVLIEILDVADGDPDEELSDENLEEDDG